MLKIYLYETRRKSKKFYFQKPRDFVTCHNYQQPFNSRYSRQSRE